MDILFVTAKLPIYEADQPLGQLLGLIKAFAAQQHHVTLGYLKPACQATLAYLAKLNVQLVSPTFWSIAARLKKALSTQHFDFIIVEGLANQSLAPLNHTKRITLLRLTENAANLPHLAGIDTAYFKRKIPFNVTSLEVIFRQSADAVPLDFLIYQTWPYVLEKEPAARLLVLSNNPPKIKLIGIEFVQVKVNGDIRPYYERCRLAVAPYLTTPSDPTPILEAWAMQLPLLILPAAIEPFSAAKLGDHYLQGRDGPTLAALIARMLRMRGPGLHLAQESRLFVETTFSWQALADKLITTL